MTERDQLPVENVTGNQTSRRVRQAFPEEMTCEPKGAGLRSRCAECLASAGKPSLFKQQAELKKSSKGKSNPSKNDLKRQPNNYGLTSTFQNEAELGAGGVP